MEPTLNCHGTNAAGLACDALEHMVDASGFCPAHREGGSEYMRAIGTKGGRATAARNAGEAFTAGELKPITTVEDAKLALDEIRVAVMTRRLTHAEGNAASKAVAEWVKAETAMITKRLTTETEAVIAEKDEEIETLRKQLAELNKGRPMRVAK